MSITLVTGQEYQLSIGLEPIPVAKARLYGTVADADTGTPIQGAVIKLAQGGVTKYQATSSSSGYYNIDNIEPGTYNGLVSATGYGDYVF